LAQHSKRLHKPIVARVLSIRSQLERFWFDNAKAACYHSAAAQGMILFINAVSKRRVC